MSAATRRRSRTSITNRRQQEEEDEGQVFYYSGIERVPRTVAVVHLHEAMQVVPYQAFHFNKVLKIVQFHDTSLRKICERAFAGCSALEEVILPDTIEEIELGAFTSCTSLHKVYISPHSRLLKVIPQAAFSSCKSLVSFQVPSSVHTIERAAFSRCERLQNIEFVAMELSKSSPEPFESQLRCIQAIAFGGCAGLQTLRLPHGLRRIENQSFSGCTWLDAVEIPATVEEISSLAFMGCHNLKHLALPQDLDLSETPDDIFQECHLLNPMLNSAMKWSDADEGADARQALQNRFEGLPIHELCYYSQDPEVLQELLSLNSDDADANISFASQDCFGMTPFHLLALSASHHKVVVSLLKLLLKDKRFQKVVTKKDVWGYYPLVYACQADAPLPVVKLLLEVHQAAEIASTEQKKGMQVDESAPPEEGATNDGTSEDTTLIKHQAPEKAITVPWNHLVRHCCSNSVKILRFIVRCCLKERIERLGLHQWKNDITFSIFKIPAEVHPEEARKDHIRGLCKQLSTFEEREALAILELAVQKVALEKAIPEELDTEEKSGDQSEEAKEDMVEGANGQEPSQSAVEKIDGEELIIYEMPEESPEEILRQTIQYTRVTCNADVIVINVRQYFKIPPIDFF